MTRGRQVFSLDNPTDLVLPPMAGLTSLEIEVTPAGGQPIVRSITIASEDGGEVIWLLIVMLTLPATSSWWFVIGRRRTGDSSPISAQTLAWLLLALSDSFANADLNDDSVSDEKYLPPIADMLKRFVF